MGKKLPILPVAGKDLRRSDVSAGGCIRMNESTSSLRRTKMEMIQMKRFYSPLIFLLLAMPVAGTAQATQKTTPQTTAPQTTAPQTTAPVPSQAPAKSTATSGTAGPALANSATYAGPMDASRYIIGPEDSLQVTVWKEPTLSGNFPVRPDGMISLVLVGDLPAAGLTPMALSNDITQRLRKYIQDPVVTVAVLGVNSQRIFMVGEVGRVGPVMLTPGMTPLQAIVTAGGLSQFANSKRIYILRMVSGKQQKIPFNYKQALKGENSGMTLLPGDTIVVP
jgi:polysaccharide export outer membrane protein